MGRYGPNFEHNMMREDGSIWPIGKSVEYPSPIIRQGQKEFKDFNEY
jgi:hypothetical protein